jgi:hypothetical protein
MYWDATNSQIVIVSGDTVLARIDATGITADLEFSGEAQGDIMLRGASAWAVLPAATDKQILIGDGTDLASVAVTGDITITNAGVTAIGASKVTNGMLAGSITRGNLLQELATMVVPLTDMRTWDARQTALPGTAAADDMGLITGTFGTDAPTLQGVDFGGASTDEACAFQFVLPQEYVAGEAVTLRCRAAILTTIADVGLTLDAEVHEHDRDGAVGADICATGAADINSLTPADIDFTITPTTLGPGDLLDIRLTFAGSDSGNLGVMIPEISQVEIIAVVKG